MHVFEVVEIEEQSIAGLPGWSLTRERRRWIARDPSGAVRASGRVKGNVEASAKEYAARGSSARPSDTEQPRDSERRGNKSNTRRASRNPVVADPSQRSAVDRGDSERGRGKNVVTRDPNGRIEPTLTRNTDTPRNTSGIETPLRALHPETPTVDDLTSAERRAYQRGESFERRVRLGNRQITIQITPDMVDEQTRIKSGNAPEVRADQRDGPESRSRNPKPSRRGIIGRLMDMLGSLAQGVSRLTGSAARLGGGAIGSIVNAALTAVEVEEELDRMLRVVQNEIERQEDEGVAPEDITWTDAMESQYRETIDELVELTFKGIIALLATASATSLIVIALGSLIGSGGTSIILGLIAGGIIGFFGTEALYQVLEYAGVMDMVENFIAEEWLKPSVILSLAAGVDVVQNMPLVPGDDPSFGGSPAEESIQEASTPNEKEVVDKLRDMIMGNPELLAIYNKGKAKAKATKAALDQGHS